jgi:hypothetical protein
MSELTIGRNLERMLGLWPSAGLNSDWRDLFTRQFQNANQHWLQQAIERVKLSKASHVPELKWFVEEFNAIRREHSQSGQAAAKSLEDKAAEKAAWLERERLEIEEANATIRRWLADIHPDTLGRIKDAMGKRAGLRDLVRSLERPVADWNAFTIQTAWAVARKDGLDDSAPATFAGASHHAGDDR